MPRPLALAAACALALVIDAAPPDSGPPDPGPPNSGPGATDTAEQPVLIDLSSIGVDPQPLVDGVATERLAGHVTIISATPRHAVADTAQARAAAAYVAEQFAGAGFAVEEIDVDAFGVTLPVVSAEIEGTECPERVFVLTAHYDTVEGTPGADDDASGVAAVIEVGRALADADLPSSVVVAAVPFEEQGPPYAGSAALAERLIVSEEREVIGMISAEMLGYTLDALGPDGDTGDYLLFFGYERAEALVQTFVAAALEWVPDFGAVALAADPDEIADVDRSDHYAFNEYGVPAAMATDTANFRNPHYHQPSDTLQTLDLHFLAGSTQALVAGTVAYASLDTDGSGAPDACESGAPQLTGADG